MNFEVFGKKVKQFGKDTVEEVQKMNEVRQLNNKVSDTKKQINNLYTEIGKKLYEQYKEAPFSGFETEIETINEKSDLIEELKEQIRKVKGVVLCPCCNMEVGEKERFCSNCGNKMPEVVNPDEADEDAIVVDSVDVTEAQSAEKSDGPAADDTTEEAVEAETVEESAEAAEENAEVVEEATEAVEESAEAVEEASEAVEESAEAVEEASEAVEESAEAVEEVSEAVEESAEAVDEASEAVEESAKAVEKASEAVEESAEAVEEV